MINVGKNLKAPGEASQNILNKHHNTIWDGGKGLHCPTLEYWFAPAENVVMSFEPQEHLLLIGRKGSQLQLDLGTMQP